MRIPRIHVAAPLQVETEIALPAQATAHVARVLRMRAGEALVLFNGDGNEYPVRLTSVSARDARAHIESVRTPVRESPLQITLVQAVARGEKMDWIIQKATELGVARVVPVTTERSEVRMDAARGEKRMEHWRAVAIAACEQCGRNHVPAIEPLTPLAAWLDTLPRKVDGPRWMLHPGDGAHAHAQSSPASVLLAVGPEGGFGDGDLAALRAVDFQPLALGPRILRTETAGLAALAAMQAWYGDF